MREDYWTGRTVVLTGAGGFIGSHFVEALLRQGAWVIGLHRGNDSALCDVLDHNRLTLLPLDLTDEAELRAVFRHAARGVDAVIHCAAMDGNAEFKANNSAKILETNLRITSNALNCARDYRVMDTILISSSEIYPPCPAGLLVEDNDGWKNLRENDNGYSISKVVIEILADQYRKQFDMRIFVPRPTNVYGPRDKFEAQVQRVIPSIIGKVARGQDVVIWGDGTQTRSFIHVADLVQAVLQMVEAGTYPVLNVATDESISIRDLVRTVFALLGKPERIRFDLSKTASGTPARQLDTRRLREVIDFPPRSLALGLRQTVQWYQHTERFRATV
jgi:nucleoside-diphosphate-sugar epimerase